ncbi:MAG: HIT family protein, partial [Minisyncoccia bacterium]
YKTSHDLFYMTVGGAYILMYNDQMQNCLFCKIIAGEIPSTKVYEDDIVLAFLDIHPVNIGHTLVIPKAHHTNLYETPNETLSRMMTVVKKLSTAIKGALSADGINIEMNNDPIAGQIIFHTHIHIVPRFSGDGFTHWPSARGYNEGEADEVSTKIKMHL